MSGTLTRSEQRLDVLWAVQPACVLRAPLFRQWGFQRKSILLKHIVRPRARSVELPYRSYRARLLVNTPLESVMFVLIDDCATGEGAARYRWKAMGNGIQVAVSKSPGAGDDFLMQKVAQRNIRPPEVFRRRYFGSWSRWYA